MPPSDARASLFPFRRVDVDRNEYVAANGCWLIEKSWVDGPKGGRNVVWHLFADVRAGLANSERGVEALKTLDSFEARFKGLRDRADREPLGVDISDYSDDFCAGFLAGQANALDEAARNV